MRPRLVPTATVAASSSSPPAWPSNGNDGEEEVESEEEEEENEHQQSETLLLLAAAADGSVSRWRATLLPPLLPQPPSAGLEMPPPLLRLELSARVSPSAPVTAVTARRSSSFASPAAGGLIALGTAAGKVHFVSVAAASCSSLSLFVGTTVPAHSRPVRGLRWLCENEEEGEGEEGNPLSGVVVSWAGGGGGLAPSSAPSSSAAGSAPPSPFPAATEDAEISLIDSRTRTATRLPLPPRGGGSYDRGEGGTEGEGEGEKTTDGKGSSSPSSALTPPEEFFSSRTEERRQRSKRRTAPLLDVVVTGCGAGGEKGKEKGASALLLVLLRNAPAELWSISSSSPPSSSCAPSSSFSASCLRLLDLPFATAAWVESPPMPVPSNTRRLAFSLADGRVGALDVSPASGAAADAAPRRPAWGLLGADAPPTALRCSGVPNVVLIGDADGGLHAWDTESGRVTTAAAASGGGERRGGGERKNEGRGGSSGGSRGTVRSIQVLSLPLSPSSPTSTTTNAPILVSAVFSGGTAGVWELRASSSSGSNFADGSSPGFGVGSFAEQQQSASSPRPPPPPAVSLLPSPRVGNSTIRSLSGGAPAISASWLGGGSGGRILLVAAAGAGSGFAGAGGSGVLALSCCSNSPLDFDLPAPPRTLGTALLLPGPYRQLLRLLLAREAVSPELLWGLVGEVRRSEKGGGGGAAAAEAAAEKVLSAMPPLPREASAAPNLVAAVRSLASLRASGKLLHAGEWRALFAAGGDPSARAAVAAAVAPPSTDNDTSGNSSSSSFWAFALPAALKEEGQEQGTCSLEPFGEAPWSPASAVAAARERAEAFGAGPPSPSPSSSSSSSSSSLTSTPLGGFAAPARGDELAALESLCLGDNATAVGLLLASAAPDAPAAERYRDALCAVAAAAAAESSLAASGSGENEEKTTTRRRRRKPPTSPLLVQAFKVAAANAAASGDALLGAYLMFAAGNAAEAAATLVAAAGGGGSGGDGGNEAKAAGAGWRLAVTLACSALLSEQEQAAGAEGEDSSDEEDRTRHLRSFLARWATASLEKERGARWPARGVLASVGAWRPLLASLLGSSSSSSSSAAPSAGSSSLAHSSPDAAASLRRALRARKVKIGEGGESETSENDAACARQWQEALFASSSLPNV